MMKIGDLAKRAGVGIDTVRYYEREGLLPQAQRRSSGYRMYDVDDIQRLRFIRRAKALGFSLDDVRELLTLSDERDIAKVKHAAVRKLGDIEQRIAELERIRAGLHDLIAACPGHGRAETCPILNALSQEETA